MLVFAPEIRSRCLPSGGPSRAGTLHNPNSPSLKRITLRCKDTNKIKSKQQWRKKTDQTGRFPEMITKKSIVISRPSGEISNPSLNWSKVYWQLRLLTKSFPAHISQKHKGIGQRHLCCMHGWWTESSMRTGASGWLQWETRRHQTKEVY